VREELQQLVIEQAIGGDDHGTGGAMVLSRLPFESAGLSFSLPSALRTNTNRPGNSSPRSAPS
jgi:hypothetical protein